MKHINAALLPAFITVIMILNACDDNTEDIGVTLSPLSDSLIVSTDTFLVETSSISVDSVLARNTVGYLGRMKDPETGAYITCHFMTQFHTMENDSFPQLDSIMSVDSDGLPIADSCEIRLFFTNFYGDSLNLMKMTVHEMGTPLRENRAYYSNYDPWSEGMIRQDGISRGKSYSLGDQNVSDSAKAVSGYGTNIRVTLNEPYTAVDGTTYNNYGTYIMRQYYAHPEYLKNSYNFIHNICPGFYFRHTDGLGTIAYITNARLNVFFRYFTEDSVYAALETFTGTEEVLQLTSIDNDDKTIARLVSDNSCTYLKTPAAIFTEMTLPVEEIASAHPFDTINSARVVLTRVNNSRQSDYALDIPQTLLMVEKDSLHSFFENSEIPDYKITFVATYSSTYNTYTFNNISGLITHLREARAKGVASDPEWTENHPDWNKVVLVPVTTSTSTVSTSTAITKVVHNMSLTETRLVGGSDNRRDAVKISIIYSKFNN